MNTSAEKRSVQRIDLEVPITLGGKAGTTRNISGGGIYFVSREPARFCSLTAMARLSGSSNWEKDLG